MRQHQEFRELLGWLHPAAIHAAVAAGVPAIVRSECMNVAGRPWLVADLTLCEGERTVCVPFVRVDVEALLRRSAPPLIWPAGVGAPRDARAFEALAQRVADVLAERYDGASLEGEHIMVLDERARAPFEAARAGGALGAAPLAVALERWAPFTAAARYARDRRVAVRCKDGAHAVAALRAVTDRIGLDRNPCPDDVALRWYALDPQPLGEGRWDVAITDAAAGDAVPPADVVVRVWGSEIVAVTGIAEPEHRPAVAAPPPVGGSAGRIALLVRPDAGVAGDADSDEAVALATAFGREGFTSRVCSDAAAVATFAPAVLHVVGLERPRDALAAIAAARACGATVVVSPLFDDPADEGWWGLAATAGLPALALDQTERELGEWLVAHRGIAAEGLFATHRNAGPAEEAARAAVVRGADVVLAQSRAEEARARTLWGVDVTTVAPAFAPAPGADPVAPVVGADPFVFAHAAIRPAANLGPVALGAARLGYPLVIAGPVADPAEAQRLRAIGGPTTMLIGDDSPALIAGLYATARVYVDVAWAGRGEHRVERALRAGAAVVRDRRRGEAPGIVPVDRADAAHVAARIGDRWLGAPASADSRDGAPAAGIREILRAYARATPAAR